MYVEEGQKLEDVRRPKIGYNVKYLTESLRNLSKNKRKTPHRTLYIKPIQECLSADHLPLQVSRLLSILQNNVKGGCFFRSNGRPFADFDSCSKGPCIILL